MQSHDLNISDEALMKLLQIGEDSAFDILYSRYAESLRLFFRRMLPDNDMADDAVHDLFLKVYSKSKSFDTERNFKSWLYSIAHNQCKNLYAKNEVRLNGAAVIKQHSSNTVSSQIESQIDRKTFSEALERKLKTIDKDNRSAFLLRFQEDMSIKEIAAILNCPEGTVKSKLHYTIKGLAKELSVYNKL